MSNILSATDEYQVHRRACAEAAKPYLRADPQGWPILETYANAEFWAGWNAAIAHAANIAEGRHRCWQESTLGSSQPSCDVTACADVAAAIRYEVHRKPCASRPHPAGEAV